MDSDQKLLDDYNASEDARRAAERKKNKAVQQWYENAAKQAHKIRQVSGLLRANSQVPSWEDMGSGSQRHLIADAQHVANNPSVTEFELRRLYRERLVAQGDTDNPDLECNDEDSWRTEEMVLARLKECLADTQNDRPASI